MSVMNARGVKIVLPRRGRITFWQKLREVYAGEDPQAWSRLAMLTLREAVDWPIEQIAVSFGQSTEHVTNCLKDVRRDLRQRLQRPTQPRRIAPARLRHASRP